MWSSTSTTGSADARTTESGLSDQHRHQRHQQQHQHSSHHQHKHTNSLQQQQHHHHEHHHHSSTPDSGPSASSSYPSASTDAARSQHDGHPMNTVYQYPYAYPVSSYPDDQQHPHPHSQEHQPRSSSTTTNSEYAPLDSQLPLPPPASFEAALTPPWMHHPYNSSNQGLYSQQGRAGSGPAGWQPSSTSQPSYHAGYQDATHYGLPPYMLSYVSSSSSSSPPVHGAKGKGRDPSDVWSEDERDMKRIRVESEMPVDVEREIEQLKTYLTQLINLIEPFAPVSTTPAPSPPPPYLHTRFARLSSLIHSTLVALSPYVHPFLSPVFTKIFTGPTARSSSPVEQVAAASPPAPTKKLEDMTPAEREMEVIRKRRDALIAKAALAAMPLAAMNKIGNSISNHTQGQGGRNGHLPMSGSLGNLSALTEASELASNQLHPLPQAHAQPQPQQSQMLSLDMLSPRSLTLMGRCHGCGSSVTREWRRGPDGPESLCDTCGMHYARLLKKKDLPAMVESSEEEEEALGLITGAGVQVT
ncbi:hypothetical protein IAR55_006725 [Kwoniella newhampshirensis]|uniref:GATA-type domain-containing protein n=1 Tax=Kwoniella newhampshirensis TaxID=1651941 RepID=A0AAW0YI13_9TREE